MCSPHRSRRRSSLLAAHAIAAAGLLMIAGPAPASPPPDGTYVFSGAAAEKRGRLAAIEDATDELFIAFRGVAERRLRKGTRIDKTMTFQHQGQRVSVAYGQLVYTLRLGAPPVEAVGNGGEKIWASAHEADGALVVEFRSKRGGRTDTFFVDFQGNLVVHVRVWSDRLPESVRYTLTYHKK
jgi:hypothetical protein